MSHSTRNTALVYTILSRGWQEVSKSSISPQETLKQYVMLCAISYHLYNSKNEKKNTHGVNTPPWVFFSYFKLHKWYQIAESDSCLQNTPNIGHNMFKNGSFNSFLDFSHLKVICQCLSPSTQKVNWAYIRRSVIFTFS